LGCKVFTGDIVLKNDSFYRNISKYLKSLTVVFEKYRKIKEMVNEDETKTEKFREFAQNLKDFKKIEIYKKESFSIRKSIKLNILIFF
jgi:hypothetical protein